MYCLVRDQSSMTLNKAFDTKMGKNEETNKNELQMAITTLSLSNVESTFRFFSLMLVS